MPLVKFLPGDGTEQWIEVHLIDSSFPRNEKGLCAFCNGDPLAEKDRAECGTIPIDLHTSRIGLYHARNPRAETCPMCHGKSS